MLKPLFVCKHHQVHNERKGVIRFSNADTTDVQLVSAMELRDVSAFRVRCDFMAGSTAQGCVVVLVGELQGNVTVNFMRGTAIDEVINTVHPTSCYNRVVAYDIESDGSVGSLAVPGRILADTTSNSVATCLQQQKAPFPCEFLYPTVSSCIYNINRMAKFTQCITVSF